MSEDKTTSEGLADAAKAKASPIVDTTSASTTTPPTPTKTARKYVYSGPEYSSGIGIGNRVYDLRALPDEEIDIIIARYPYVKDKYYG